MRLARGHGSNHAVPLAAFVRFQFWSISGRLRPQRQECWRINEMFPDGELDLFGQEP
jgi:hypothetical protein